MEKINIAELLKDCPQGMELDCLLFKDTPVYFNRILNNYHYPIEIKVEYPDGSFEKFELSKEGCIYDRIIAKCVIFPKGKTTWEGFVPPCKFEDGDVIYTDDFIAILSDIIECGTVYYHCYYNIRTKRFKAKQYYGIGNINYDEFRIATEEEKAKLFKAIKDNGYKWNAETKTLEKLIEPIFKVGDRIKMKGIDDVYAMEITEVTQTIYTFKNGSQWGIESVDKDYELVPNKFDINILKPFDKVLVRVDNSYWRIQFFERINKKNKNYPFVCMNGSKYKQCIPYEGNEHLLGKTDDCNEYFKNW